MAYIGRQLVRGQNRIYDDISSSFNGSTTAFNLTIGGDATPPAQVNQLWIILGGILQKPGTDFTVADAQVTFTTAPAAGLDFWAMIQGDTSDMNAPSDGSVTPTKIATSGDFAFPADVRFKDADGSHYVGLQAPTTVSSNLVWTLPAADGSANQILKTNGSGVLGWATDSATDSTKMPLAGGTFTGDVTFDGATAGRDIVWDKSDNALEFADNAKGIFGTGADLEIYHDATDNQIKSTNGKVVITTTAGNSDIEITPNGSGNVKLDGLDWPNADGSANQYLKTDGSGALSWSTVTTTALTGSTNNTICTVTGANAIAGEANLTFDGDNLVQSIDAGGEGIKISAAGNHYPVFTFDADRSAGDNNCGQLEFKWDGTSIARIAAITGSDTTNKDDGILAFMTSPSGSLSERLRIAADGKVGINTTSPAEILDVNGTASLDYLIVAHSGLTNTQKVTIAGSGVASGDDLTINSWGNSDGDYWTIGTNVTANSGGSLSKTNDTNRSAAILLDGRMGRMILNTSQSGTSTRTDTHTWDKEGDYTLTGNVVIGTAGKGIDFSAQTPASQTGTSTGDEVLDHYEEGTWTPTVYSTGSGTFTYGSQAGIYTRIGSWCFCSGLVNATVGGTESGAVRIGQLPFNAADTSANYGQFHTTDYGNFDSYTGTVGGYLQKGNSYVVLLHTTTASSTTIATSDWGSGTYIYFNINYKVA